MVQLRRSRLPQSCQLLFPTIPVWHTSTGPQSLSLAQAIIVNISVRRRLHDCRKYSEARCISATEMQQGPSQGTFLRGQNVLIGMHKSGNVYSSSQYMKTQMPSLHFYNVINLMFICILIHCQFSSGKAVWRQVIRNTLNEADQQQRCSNAYQRDSSRIFLSLFGILKLNNCQIKMQYLSLYFKQCENIYIAGKDTKRRPHTNLFKKMWRRVDLV